MPDLDYSAVLTAARAAALSGAAQLESWRGRFTAREKARADLVSEADLAAQVAIREVLGAAFPGYGFVGEEDSVGHTIEQTRPASDSGPVWVVDPLDGTVNYVHDVPAYCVSIGLYLDGRAVAGVIYDPRLNEMFAAAEGRGATLNDEPIAVSRCAKLGDALLSTGFPANLDAQARNLAAWSRLSQHTQALRRTGSTALNMAYVACGRFDGYWAYDNYAWDVMAGAVLITEAGGVLSGADGRPYDPFRMDICAAPPGIHAELLRVLADQSSV